MPEVSVSAAIARPALVWQPSRRQTDGLMCTHTVGTQQVKSDWENVDACWSWVIGR